MSPSSCWSNRIVSSNPEALASSSAAVSVHWAPSAGAVAQAPSLWMWSCCVPSESTRKALAVRRRGGRAGEGERQRRHEGEPQRSLTLTIRVAPRAPSADTGVNAIRCAPRLNRLRRLRRSARSLRPAAPASDSLATVILRLPAMR